MKKGISKKLIGMKMDLYNQIKDVDLKRQLALVFGQYNLEIHLLQKEIQELKENIEVKK